jgi:flagellin-specific chaperone FliS
MNIRPLPAVYAHLICCNIIVKSLKVLTLQYEHVISLVQNLFIHTLFTFIVNRLVGDNIDHKINARIQN